MIPAILEILGLVTVSCLIGVLFTYRFWKAKYKLLEADMKKRVNDLLADIEALEAKVANLESSLKEATEATIEREAILAKKAPAKTKNNSSELKAMKSEIVLLKEEMGEKEREIEALSRELEAKKISYYKVIDGKRYKGITIKMADEAIAGRGDGRISMDDAEKIFDTISDGKAYTQVEKDTLRRLRTNYKWTEQADELFRKKVRSWAAKGHVLD